MTEIEAKLREVNELIVSSHTSFEQVRDGLRRVQSVVPLASGEAVSIEAVPNRMFDMLAKAQVQLGTSGGATIPLGRHGEGTQGLAVLMLFSAFLEAQSEGAAVLALEEPEAHLHPSAISALWELGIAYVHSGRHAGRGRRQLRQDGSECHGRWPGTPQFPTAVPLNAYRRRIPCVGVRPAPKEAR